MTPSFASNLPLFMTCQPASVLPSNRLSNGSALSSAGVGVTQPKSAIRHRRRGSMARILCSSNGQITSRRGGEGAVEQGHVLAALNEVLAVGAVPVPAREVHRHHAGAGLDESARQAEVAHHARGAVTLEDRVIDAVALQDLRVLLVQVQGID